MSYRSTVALIILVGLVGTQAKTKQQPFYLVDAFTVNDNSPYTGSPSGVVILDYDDDITDDAKRNITLENNQDVTAFISYGWKNGENISNEAGPQIHSRTIRWFIKNEELPLCGAGTIAATKPLLVAQLGASMVDPAVKKIEISFHTKSSGKLGVTMDMATGSIALAFPSNPPKPFDKSKHSWVDGLIEATLGKDVPPSAVTEIQYMAEVKTLLLRLDADKGTSIPDLLRKINPDFTKMMEINTDNSVSFLVVTVKGEAEANGDTTKGTPHFYSRCFAPWKDINEDPANGLSHTILTPYWADKLSAGGKQVGTMIGRVLSKRGGRFLCTLMGDKVQLGGDARITIQGHLAT